MNLTRTELEAILPHRHPILLLDRVEELEPQKRGIGIRFFGESDAVFEGHFPGLPILPGVFIIEALAQTAAAVMLAPNDQETNQSRIGLLGKVSDIQFTHRVLPNQELAFHITVDRALRDFAFVSGQAFCDGTPCASGKLVLKTEAVESEQMGS